MAKPAAYSNTDTAEENAVDTFKLFLDNRYVKADIRTRDKYPNIDGTLELVDHDQVPLGTLGVQVKSIKKDAKNYSCPTSLVAYSEIYTLPVILVCVDSTSQKVFWKQIDQMMPEYKKDQDSFTIHFSDETDIVDGSGLYVQKWAEIIGDYQGRIAKFPLLSAEVANKVEVKGVKPTDLEKFQRYISEVNNLFDKDFHIVKKILYPDVWMLGVGIISSDDKWFKYHIYRIPYREPTPLVCRLEKDAFKGLNAIADIHSNRESFDIPEEAGKNFVISKVRRIINSRSFLIRGKVLATDILFNFADKYYRCLGLPRYQDTYLVSEIDFALNVYLRGMCTSYVAQFMTEGHFSYLDLDSVAESVAMNEIKPTTHNENPVRFSIGTKKLSMRSVFNSLDYLKANNIEAINRPFARRNMPISSNKCWIWEGYSRDVEIESVRYILHNSLREYREFVNGNQLQLPNSPYLDFDTSILFVYKPTESIEDRPFMHEYHVRNTQGNLPKFIVLIKGKDEYTIKGSSIVINDQSFEIISSLNQLASELFHELPVLRMIYKILIEDLSLHYNVKLSMD